MPFLISPNRLQKINSISKAIFGHVGFESSQFGPMHAPARRSPRQVLMQKLRGGKLANYSYPFIRPQILSDRVFRQEELREDTYETAFETKVDESWAEFDASRNVDREVKKEDVPLTKGKKRSGGD